MEFRNKRSRNGIPILFNSNILGKLGNWGNSGHHEWNFTDFTDVGAPNLRRKMRFRKDWWWGVL